MKGGTPTNALRMSLEPATALSLHLFQLVERCESPIGKWFIGERPQPFGGLQFRRMRWQKEQVQSLWQAEIMALVPACLIQNQGNLFVWPDSLFICESTQGQRKGGGIDRRHE